MTMFKQLYYRIKILFVFIAILFFSFSNSYGQEDEIFLKQTGQPLDYHIKIYEVKNDTIYYKAFGKMKEKPFSEVKKYRMGGVIYFTNPISPEQKKKVDSLVKQSDSIKCEIFPKGGYMSIEELMKKTPSIPYNFKIEKRSKNDIIMVGGNDYKFYSTTESITKKIVLKKIFAISDGDTLYINGFKYKIGPWYAQVISTGNYFIFRAAMSNKDATAQATAAGLMGGAIGGAIAGASIAQKRSLYVLDSSSGKVSTLNSKYLIEKLASSPDILNVYDKENNKDSESTLIKYAKLLNKSTP